MSYSVQYIMNVRGVATVLAANFDCEAKSLAFYDAVIEANNCSAAVLWDIVYGITKRYISDDYISTANTETNNVVEGWLAP